MSDKESNARDMQQAEPSAVLKNLISSRRLPAGCATYGVYRLVKH